MPDGGGGVSEDGRGGKATDKLTVLTDGKGAPGAAEMGHDGTDQEEGWAGFCSASPAMLL